MSDDLFTSLKAYPAVSSRQSYHKNPNYRLLTGFKLYTEL